MLPYTQHWSTMWIVSPFLIHEDVQGKQGYWKKESLLEEMCHQMLNEGIGKPEGKMIIPQDQVCYV